MIAASAQQISDVPGDDQSDADGRERDAQDAGLARRHGAYFRMMTMAAPTAVATTPTTSRAAIKNASRTLTSEQHECMFVPFAFSMFVPQ